MPLSKEYIDKFGMVEPGGNPLCKKCGKTWGLHMGTLCLVTTSNPRSGSPGSECTCCGCGVLTCVCECCCADFLSWLTKSLSVHWHEEVPFEDITMLLGAPDSWLETVALWYIYYDASRATGDPEIHSEYASRTESLAAMLLNYCTLACFGEARYACCTEITTDREYLHGIAQTVRAAPSFRGVHRTTAWRIAASVMERSSIRETLEAAWEIFHFSHWPSGTGVGGPRWELIAKIALDYAQGKISPVIFIDTIVNIVHNGGWAFGKYYASSLKRHSQSHTYRIDLQIVLDTRARSGGLALTDFICVPENIKALVEKDREERYSAGVRSLIEYSKMSRGEHRGI